MKKFLIITAITFGTTVFLIAGYWLSDAYRRYESWNNLSPQSLKLAALNYYGGAPVCLYVVDCSSERARLVLVKDYSKLDFEGLKQTIWDRRFNGYCKGYTENIVIDIPKTEPGKNKDARWSFFNDRFVTNHGRFQGSAASFYPYEECLEGNVTWSSGNKKLQPTANASAE